MSPMHVRSIGTPRVKGEEKSIRIGDVGHDATLEDKEFTTTPHIEMNSKVEDGCEAVFTMLHVGTKEEVESIGDLASMPHVGNVRSEEVDPFESVQMESSKRIRNGKCERKKERKRIRQAVERRTKSTDNGFQDDNRFTPLYETDESIHSDSEAIEQ